MPPKFNLNFVAFINLIKFPHWIPDSDGEYDQIRKSSSNSTVMWSPGQSVNLITFNMSSNLIDMADSLPRFPNFHKHSALTRIVHDYKSSLDKFTKLKTNGLWYNYKLLNFKNLAADGLVLTSAHEKLLLQFGQFVS